MFHGAYVCLTGPSGGPYKGLRIRGQPLGLVELIRRSLQQFIRCRNVKPRDPDQKGPELPILNSTM
jgi:hypothetical protein